MLAALPRCKADYYIYKLIFYINILIFRCFQVVPYENFNQLSLLFTKNWITKWF